MGVAPSWSCHALFLLAPNSWDPKLSADVSFVSVQATVLSEYWKKLEEIFFWNDIIWRRLWKLYHFEKIFHFHYWVTSNFKWKIFWNFVPFSECPNFTVAKNTCCLKAEQSFWPFTVQIICSSFASSSNLQNFSLFTFPDLSNPKSIKTNLEQIYETK